ncbi:PA14 domain-containing protein [Fibrella forsythiae]|uniref:OmpA family protein n=1 Tax=Fibrella forsythiae TaxID=2817061 RepID=A0ABS3JE30_9BACT|nr:PA14 domain-containing protein [Fibrella forsythiae]MBO0948248.1 OmpA family protein [Fibrella forsythiae]
MAHDCGSLYGISGPTESIETGLNDAIGMLRGLLVVGGWLSVITCWGQAAKSASAAGNGLVGEYYAGATFNRKVLVRTDPQIDFSWDGYTLPAPGVTPNSFSVRWTGKVYAPVTGPYKFTAVVDDGIRIWVDGKLAMDEWRYRRQKLAGQSVTLQAGKFYDLKIEYYNAKNGGYVQLNWNLVNEAGKSPAFENAPQQKISGQFLYNGTPQKTTLPPAVTPKPKPVPAVVPKKVLPVAVKKSSVDSKSDASKSTLAGVKPVPPRAVTAQVPTLSAPVTTSVSEPTRQLVTATTSLPVVKQIAFAQSDYQLLPSSYEALNELATTMRRDTTIRLTIAGHTDNIGDPRLNLTLSEHRAKVVRFYLVRQGIAEHRLTIVAFGGSYPLASNETEAGREQNRRVEFKFQP